MRVRAIYWTIASIFAASGIAFAAQTPIPAVSRVVGSIPLCAGMTVVTAVSQSNGDYESIKTVQAASDSELTLKYSSEAMEQDPLSNAPTHLVKTNLSRRVLVADLRNANLYEQQFYTQMPVTAPGTTAIGTSTKVLNALRTSGEADIGIFLEFSGDVSTDRNNHPNVYDFQMIGHVKRVEPKDVMVPILVNDVPSLVPAIHVQGDFMGDLTEFYFLDDPANPLTLKYRFGIGSAPSGDLSSIIAALNNNSQPRSEKDKLEVTKIAFRCAPLQRAMTSSGSEGGGSPAVDTGAAASSLEQLLAKNGKVQIYDIYFSFNSAEIRPESEPSLKEIASVLSKHSDWKLNVAGHTDNVGGDQFNLVLSQRRAAAVKMALVTRYHIDGSRLSTAGYGDAQPQDTNATLEGRARNRRVELTR